MVENNTLVRNKIGDHGVMSNKFRELMPEAS